MPSPPGSQADKNLPKIGIIYIAILVLLYLIPPFGIVFLPSIEIFSLIMTTNLSYFLYLGMVSLVAGSVMAWIYHFLLSHSKGK